MAELEFVVVGDRSPDGHRRAAAVLVEASFAEYYGLLPVDEAERHDAIARQIGTVGTELAHTVLAVRNGEPVGAYAARPAAGLTQAQMLGALDLAKPLGAEARRAFLDALHAFAEQVPPVPDDGCYLARFAVEARLRGHNIGARVIEHLTAEAAGQGHRTVSAHVRVDNEGAIRFYEAHGFSPLGHRDRNYLAMVRDVAAG